MEIDQILDNIYPLVPERSKRILKKNIALVTYPKGHILLRSDKTEKDIYFIRKGMVRAYTDTGENEVTFWFGKEGDPVMSMKSYILGQPGYEPYNSWKRVNFII